MTLIKNYGVGFIGLLALAGGTAACSSDNNAPVGPGASLVCPSSGKNAFDTYGSAFGTVNEAIFTSVGDELTANGTTNLGDSFGVIGTTGHDDGPTFHGKLAAFLVFVYGGPDNFTYTDGINYDGAGQDMATEHLGLAITSDQYDYFVTSVIVPVLLDAGVPQADVDACFAPPLVDATFKASIVGQ